jgi:serine/threonine protein kinase
MPVPLTTEQLVELIRKSNLIESARLDAHLQQQKTLPATAVDLAQDLINQGLITNFQKEQLLQGKWRGYTIGKFKVLERLGAGGMGSVYLCEHLKMKHKVAVKVLPTAKACDPAALGRFYREARAAGVLDHPNLVRAHDIDQDGELHYLVLDYVDGVNLQHLVNRYPGKLPVERACHYIYQAAQGLQHAFECGLIHRDVKPANLLVDRQGVIRILDLGLARFYEDNQDLLTLKYDDNNVLGTADYVSPEQAMDSHDVDIRTDVYSLGATFYFLLTGQPLFPEGRVAQKLIWHKDREPKPIHELRGDMPVELETIVMKMMAKEREDRYQTPAEVMAALEPWVQTPIAPPSDAELPNLCPAARGGPNENGSGGRSPAGRSPVGSRKQDSAGVSGPRRTSPSRTATQAVIALPATGPSAEHATPHRLSAEESTARVRASLESTPVFATAPKPKGRIGRLIYMGTMLALGVTAGVFMRMSMRGTEPPPPPVIGKRVLVVDHSGRGDTHASILEALKTARPGDTVEVREAVWEEVLRLESGGTLGRGVTLTGKGQDGKPTLWQPPPGQHDVPSLIHFSSIAGLRLQNFTLDGKDTVQHLVTISGPSGELTLEDLKLQAFRSSGVRLTSAVAEEHQPLLFQRLQIHAGREAEAGILIDSLLDQPSKCVRISECRIEGPGHAGVVVSGPVGELEIARCEICGLSDGVLYRSASVPLPIQLTLTGNTFRDLQRTGLRIETTLKSETSRVTLKDNRFKRVKVLGWLEGFKTEPGRTPAAWIWSNEPVGGPAKVQFRKRFNLESAPTRATLSLTGDESFTVWVNGQRAGQGTFNERTRRIQAFDVARFLRQGDNVLAVEATGRAGRSGVLAELDDNGSGIFTRTLVSDPTWKVTTQALTGWQESAYDETNWPVARLVTPYGKGEPAWQQLIWDALLQEHFKYQTERIFPAPTGNERDAESSEGFPLFDATIKPAHAIKE